MRRIILAAPVLLASTPAIAWSHTGRALAPEDRPLVVSVEVDPIVPNMTSDQVLAEIQAIVDAWDAASCGVGVEFVGEVDYADPTDVPPEQLHLSFAPLGDGAFPFVRLGAVPPSEVVFEREGRTYSRSFPGPWVVNADLDLRTAADVLADDCSDALAFQTVVGLVIGAELGLDRSFENSALMSYRVPLCELVLPGADDGEGLDALYGPWVSLECVNPDDPRPGEAEVGGVVPFDVDCELVHDDRTTLDEAVWNFGDGTSDEGIEVVHGYERSDNYSIFVDVVGAHETCGDVDRRVERFNYVRACGEPVPDFRFERELGLSFRLVNQSDLGTYGCVNDVDWTVFDEEGDRVFRSSAWEPVVELPEEGVFRGVMALTGPGGTSTTEVVLDTRDESRRTFSMGWGCSGIQASGAGSALGLVGLLILFRRRRT